MQPASSGLTGVRSGAGAAEDEDEDEDVEDVEDDGADGADGAGVGSADLPGVAELAGGRRRIRFFTNTFTLAGLTITTLPTSTVA